MTTKTATLALLATLAALPAAAQELRWQTRPTGEGVIVAWEVPETGDQSLALFCRSGGRQIEMRLLEERDRARDGVTLPVDFATAGGQQRLSMKGEMQELGDALMLLGSFPADAAWRQLFTAGGALSITLAGETETVPLAGAAPAMTALFDACQGK
ncbi:hypothetical protein BKE38_14170 [Pseudoroseomonas deserti]|uniref:Invasion associated locus B family protein n=1 Tax=Teichococcus deserti TaxID=1817963 RepID=A0A1V2H192_9PROT|nr:hypothetical protein [Pseudoroseomonas deserti]ONG52605.1 hypothetical protein BKE38_14170 [Pseudoroseomonas deserti]